MRVNRQPGYIVLEGGPVPPGADAITIGSVISMRKRATGSRRLLRHELVHVEQWRRQGVVRFALSYVGSYALWRVRGYPHWGAYRRVPQEIEADWRSRRS